MKNLLTYEEDMVLFEENKLSAYFRENPDRVKMFGNLPLPSSHEDFGAWLQKSYQSNNPVKAQYEAQIERIKKQFPELQKITSNQYSKESIWEAISWSNALINDPEPFRRDWNVAKSMLAKRQLTPEAETWFSKNWEQFSKMAFSAAKLRIHSDTWANDKIEKEARLRGLDRRSYIAALAWIERLTEMSGRKLPKEIWQAIRALTVEENELPEYVYRGLFYDGKKIKDKEKFLAKWRKGSMPNVSQGKATSWSASKNIAVQFITPQDKIEDRLNGFHVVLKWKVDPKFVIADLRNVDGQFWNQQEIIVDPAAKDYIVDEIFEHDPEGTEYKDSNYRKFQAKNSSANGGAVGIRRSEMMLDILDVYNMDIPRNLKYEWKELKDQTIGEIEDKNRINVNGWTSWSRSEQRSILLSTFMGLKAVTNGLYGCIAYPTKAVDDSKIEISFLWEIGLDSYQRDKMFSKLIWPDFKSELKLPYNLKVGGKGLFELVQNDPMSFKFKLILPTSIGLDQTKTESWYSDWTEEELRNAKLILSSAKKHLAQILSITKTQIETSVNSRNVKISVSY